MGAFSSICCVTRGAQQELKRFYPQFADKITYIENIVPYREIHEKANAQTIHHEANQIVLCSCGRLSQEKGYDIAVEAARILKEKGLPFVWYFVGDGPERQKLEEMIATYGLHENIILTGMQENPYPYIKSCDIYVQPSREESQGLTIIEAQILLRPVVSTRTVGGLSLIQDGVNGLLSDINASSLANVIQRLANDAPLREKMQHALEVIDYEEKERVFKQSWAKLLEGETLPIENEPR